MKTITIIGSGMMGSALAFPARENGNRVRLVGTPLDREIIEVCRKTGQHPKFERPFPQGVEYYQIEQLPQLLGDTDFFICGVSSFGVSWFAEEMLPILPENVPVISVTKGLMDTEDGKLLTYLDVWQQALTKLGKCIPLNAIGGPCTSYELVAHDQTEVSFCGKDMEILRMLKEAMATDYYHISLSTDIVGVESAVALKNGYALGVALTIGINQKQFGLDSPLHFNSQAAVFGQAVREMSKLLQLQGAGDLNNLVVGLGDLYVTIYGGRTRLIGILLGRGMGIKEALDEFKGVTLESLVVAGRVAKALRIKAARGEANLEDFPLLTHMDDIITNGAAVAIPWEKFTYET